MRFTIKSKKILSAIMALSMVTASTAAAGTGIVSKIIPANTLSASAAVWGNWEYTVLKDNTCKITKYRGTEQNVIPPVAINGHTVSAFGNSAFEGNSFIRSVSIPKGVSSLPSYTFRNCSNLRTVTLPPSLDRIGSFSFENDSNLETVSGSLNIHYVEQGAFRNSGLKKFIIQYPNTSGTHWLGQYAFQNCWRLSQVELLGTWNMGKEAFSGCNALTDITATYDTMADGFRVSSFKGANNLVTVNGRTIWATKAGRAYILQEWRPYVNPYESRLLQDRVRMYMDYYNY